MSRSIIQAWARRIGCLGLILAIGIACPGCFLSGEASVTELLESQIEDILSQIDSDTVRIRVINQTGVDVQLDLLIDGLPQRIECLAALGVCDVPLVECPTRIEAVQERRMDAFGQFQGGRNFNSSADFVFTEGEFECDSIIVFDFSETSARAYAL